MLQQVVNYCNQLFEEVIKKLPRYEKRKICARIAMTEGWGGITEVSRLFKISRDTIRKGMHEVTSGFECVDAFNLRGRKKATEKQPELKNEIDEILLPRSQADPTFKSTRLYTNDSVCQIRKQLIEKGYGKEELPSDSTLARILDSMGYNRKKVLKAKPIKKIPQTDAIFKNLFECHKEIKDLDEVVHLSIDCKDRVKIGRFSRSGKSRVTRKAFDHDFGKEFVTPFGILDVKNDIVDLSIATGHVTADFIVDRLREYWISQGWAGKKKILVLNADNGPENHSRRSQFMKRILEFAVEFDVLVHLLFYPPYHSKYNRIERFWGILELHWNGDLMDSKQTVVEYCKTVTWKGRPPIDVKLIDKQYAKKQKLKKAAMKLIESVIERLEGIEKYAVIIDPDRCKEIIPLLN
jgi:hypothetical protein